MKFASEPLRLQAAEPVHRAEDLIGTDGTAKIVLRDQCYTLRLTRSGKLILTK